MIYIGGMAGFLNVSAGCPALIRVKKRSFHDIALSGAQKKDMPEAASKNAVKSRFSAIQ